MSIVIHNPSDAEVKDYPIQNPQDKNEILLWNIMSGETLEFPDYVGKYLLEVYGFLQEVMTQDQYDVKKEEEKKIQEGKVYSQVKIVKGEDEIIKSEEEIATISAPQSGFTNANMQPAEEPKVFKCPKEDCGQEFKAANHLKVHYALKHAELPV